MKFKSLLGFLLCLSLLFFPIKALAAEEFSSSYDVIYEVGEDGVTLVTQNIQLKNLTSQYYASNFTLSIGSTTLSDVTASDGAGPMEVKTQSDKGKTSIQLKLNQQVVGLNKGQLFTLKFKSRDFAQNIGKTWEVNLPRVPEAKNIESYNLVLSVPVNFGDPTSISPLPKSQSQTYNRLFFSYDKPQLISSGVSVNFGLNQIFDFTLKYSLENQELFPLITSVALPPDTQYQDVIISQIEPKPLNVTRDENGNYLAWYKLPRRQRLEVIVHGSAKLYINPKRGSNPLLSTKQLENFLKSDRFWEKDTPAIPSTLTQIFRGGKPKTNKEIAYKIYEYVVETLKYDQSRLKDQNIERLGAITALNNPEKSVCMEFTDLFITLSRAAGVPARELDGFAYSQNKSLRPLSFGNDLLHAWPEYYDENRGWVMVDPTWESTSGGVDYFNKFDLNHLVLAIRGSSSQAPSVTDNVEVKISLGDFLGKPQPKVAVEVPQIIYGGLPAIATITVTNEGNSVLLPTSLSLSTDKINILGPKTASLDLIPPFGHTTYEVNLKTPWAIQGFQDNFQVEVSGQKISKNITVKPLFMFLPLPYVLGGLVILALIVYGVVLGRHILRKRGLATQNPNLSTPVASNEKSTSAKKKVALKKKTASV